MSKTLEDLKKTDKVLVPTKFKNKTRVGNQYMCGKNDNSKGLYLYKSAGIVTPGLVVSPGIDQMHRQANAALHQPRYDGITDTFRDVQYRVKGVDNGAEVAAFGGGRVGRLLLLL